MLPSSETSPTNKNHLLFPNKKPSSRSTNSDGLALSLPSGSSKPTATHPVKKTLIAKTGAIGESEGLTESILTRKKCKLLKG